MRENKIVDKGHRDNNIILNELFDNNTGSQQNNDVLLIHMTLQHMIFEFIYILVDPFI